MCRWAAYRGPELFLGEIVSAPAHSLVAQSHCAREAKSPTNGDGFGVAWYGALPEPGLYRDILPAWSDPNLKSVCRQIRSRLFLAHVRAATSGATSRANCHPFVHGRWSFMHNGQIGAWGALRRPLEALLPDPLFAAREGSTDSELLFLLMLAEGLNDDPRGAVERTVRLVLAAAAARDVEAGLKLTAAFSDGRTLWAIRWASEGEAPTLYAAGLGSGRCLMSEPFDHARGGWAEIPTASLVRLDDGGMVVRPFFADARRLPLAG